MKLVSFITIKVFILGCIFSIAGVALADEGSATRRYVSEIVLDRRLPVEVRVNGMPIIINAGRAEENHKDKDKGN